jgi:hypothetical protein
VKKYAHLAVSTFVLTDLAAVTLAWLTAYFLRFDVEIIPALKPHPPFLRYLSFVPIVLVLWLAAARFVGLYRPEFGRSVGTRIWNIWKAATLALILLTSLDFFYRELFAARISRVVMAYDWIVVTVYVFIARSLAVALLKDFRKRGYEVRRILIAGTRDLGRDLGRRMRANEVLGLEVVGFLTDNAGEVGTQIEGASVAGTLEQVQEVIIRLGADQLFIALPMDSLDRLQRILDGLGEELIDVKVVPDFLTFMKLNAGIEDFDGLPVISLRESPLFGVNRLVKRAADVLISLIALVTLSPVMLLTALAVKLTSFGPVFYRQERMGLDGVSDRGGLGECGRPAPDAYRAFSAKDEPGRAPPVVQRFERGHESGRPASGAPGVRRGFQKERPRLHAAPHGQGGDHRLGAGQRVAGEHPA